MKPLPFKRSPSKFGGSAGLRSLRMLRVTTVVGAGVGIGCVVGRVEETNRVRTARVSFIACKVLSIFASLLAIHSSSSVSRELVVSGNGGNGVSESIFAGVGEGASRGVKTSLLDEADREHSPKRVIFAGCREA